MGGDDDRRTDPSAADGAACPSWMPFRSVLGSHDTSVIPSGPEGLPEMGESIGEMLQQDMVCEGLLECFHGLKDLDREVFGALVEADEPMTVDEVAEAVDRERSTAYRSVRRLENTGLVKKEQINYEQGGYYHVFHPADPDEVANEMQRMLNDWYAQMGTLIAEFRNKYQDADAIAVPTQD
jgi:predicted transcriptional regulator